MNKVLTARVSLVVKSPSEWRENIRDLLVSTGGIAIIFVVGFLTLIAVIKCIKATQERLNATRIEKQAIQNVAKMLSTQSPLHYDHTRGWQAIKSDENLDEIKIV